MDGHAAFQKAVDQFSDVRWRLDNLYSITDKQGAVVPFKMNWAQEALFDEMHYLNLILKARQLGFTTFIQLLMLDACVFNSNIRAGTIAHNLDDAETIFRDKVKFPYDSLPEQIRAANPATQDSAKTLTFANNSSIRVGTSMRSGTLNYLHVSEYGKICAKFPDKAREIRTGALNTIQAGQIACIESTAEGQEGDFFEKCQAAQTKERTKAALTPLDFKFFFFPWWESPEYELASEGVLIEPLYKEYFDALKVENGIKLSPRQKAWYVKKAEQQGDDMKREYPSTPKEAFEASVEGAYYAPQIAKAEVENRITAIPYEPELPVYTAWDLGMSDNMAIWFFQVSFDGLRIIDYYENSGEAIPYYADVLETKPYKYAENVNCYVPHDAKVKELGTGRTRVETMRGKGLKPQVIPNHYVADGIQAVRSIIKDCWFDEEKTAQGLKCLRAYRKDWDDKQGTWKSNPRHDWSSHGADAFRYLAMAYKELKPEEPKNKLSPPVDVRKPTLDEMVEEYEKDKGKDW